ncbi:hypothetical protein CONLIGDRAFT_650687 [Coniochaeta ligniaria NRRL 30616]|uniref:Uncharacterized protein n=1 Tax=Coniochaeta ligniaria NRRL 30616 TaxID=1408157 RepID=A0A1J7I4G6_9PEZI|nr:hypothetical protein CONLIGDRAFT_650687 [Coniochaeta ligniaria NRRL 30616]
MPNSLKALVESAFAIAGRLVTGLDRLLYLADKPAFPKVKKRRDSLNPVAPRYIIYRDASSIGIHLGTSSPALVTWKKETVIHTSVRWVLFASHSLSAARLAVWLAISRTGRRTAVAFPLREPAGRNLKGGYDRKYMYLALWLFGYSLVACIAK